MDLCIQSCLSIQTVGWPSCLAKSLMLDIMCKLFNQIFFILAMFVGKTELSGTNSGMFTALKELVECRSRIGRFFFFFFFLRLFTCFRLIRDWSSE